LNFALAYDLIVADTHSRNRVSHLVTFSNGLHCSQIDFILKRRENRHTCLDCKVTLREREGVWCLNISMWSQIFAFGSTFNGVSASKYQGRSHRSVKKSQRRISRGRFFMRALV
jgi:hypothetical protein